MIAIETSSLLCILLGEPGAAAHQRAIENADHCVTSAVSLLEAGIVMRARFGVAGVDTLMRLIRDAAIEVAPFDVVQTVAAIEAFGRHGKGIDSAARLNFGDSRMREGETDRSAATAIGRVRGRPRSGRMEPKLA